MVGERFNSYEIRKLKKRETGDTNISSRKNSIIVGTRRDNSFFIDSKHKKTSKKKCECWTYINIYLYLYNIYIYLFLKNKLNYFI